MKNLLRLLAIALIFVYGTSVSLADNDNGQNNNSNVVITDPGPDLPFSPGYYSKVSAPRNDKNNRIQEDPISGIQTVGTGGRFSTLAAAFDYVNNYGLSGNLTLQIISNITETEMAYLTTWSETGTGNYTLTVQPGGVGGWTVSGSHGDELVVIDGKIGRASCRERV